MKRIAIVAIIIGVGLWLWRKATARPKTTLDEELVHQENLSRAAGYWTTRGMLAKPAVSTIGAAPYTGISGSPVNSYDQKPGSTQFRPTVGGTSAGLSQRIIAAFGSLFPALDPQPDKVSDQAPVDALNETADHLRTKEASTRSETLLQRPTAESPGIRVQYPARV